MTELSPAAQAVAKAALYVSSCDPEDYPNQAEEIAAAALRAAAIYSYCPVDRKRLAAIADELEAQ